jgi:hypothetical protein
MGVAAGRLCAAAKRCDPAPVREKFQALQRKCKKHEETAEGVYFVRQNNDKLWQM